MKLEAYDHKWIISAIDHCVMEYEVSFGLSGMANGVDLWFCAALHLQNIGYNAFVPFDEQQHQADLAGHGDLRRDLLSKASTVFTGRNHNLITKCQQMIAVWDGNKGGTHNVVQQTIEAKKNLIWINPVAQQVYDCRNK